MSHLSFLSVAFTSLLLLSSLTSCSFSFTSIISSFDSLPAGGRRPGHHICTSRYLLQLFFIAKVIVKSSWCIPLPNAPCAFSMPALHTLFWAVSLLTSSSSRFTTRSYCQLSSVYSLGLFLKSCPRFCAPVLLEHFCHHSNLPAGSSPASFLVFVLCGCALGCLCF